MGGITWCSPHVTASRRLHACNGHLASPIKSVRTRVRTSFQIVHTVMPPRSLLTLCLNIVSTKLIDRLPPRYTFRLPEDLVQK